MEWSNKVAYTRPRKFLTHIRGRAIHVPPEVLGDIYEHAAIDDFKPAQFENLHYLLRCAVGTLTDKQKFVFYQVCVLHRKQKDVAADMGVTPGTLSHTLSRAVAKILSFVRLHNPGSELKFLNMLRK